MSDELDEELGVKQGHVKSSDHYKIYNKSLLDTVDSANLGVQIGPYNFGVSCCADDFMGMTDDQNKLQCIMEIAQYYGETYEITYGSDKSKIIVYGSKCDINYFSDIHPWRMNGDYVSVVSDNEHLGQVISNINEYQKNIDQSITKAKNLKTLRPRLKQN